MDIIHDAPGTTPEQVECVFCEIIAGRAPASVVRQWPEVIAIRPCHPITPGHTLVIPHAHVADVGADPAVSARTMAAAAQLDLATGRAVLGCPPDCPNPERNRYLIYVARGHDVPVRETLPAAVAAALTIAVRGTCSARPEDGTS